MTNENPSDGKWKEFDEFYSSHELQCNFQKNFLKNYLLN